MEKWFREVDVIRWAAISGLMSACGEDHSTSTADARADGPHAGARAAAEMARLHRERFERFQRVRAAHDQGGKFLNDFTRRVLRGLSGGCALR